MVNYDFMGRMIDLHKVVYVSDLSEYEPDISYICVNFILDIGEACYIVVREKRSDEMIKKMEEELDKLREEFNEINRPAVYGPGKVYTPAFKTKGVEFFTRIENGKGHERRNI